MIRNAAQRTNDWRRARLGCFTGSMLGKLMQCGRAGAEFGQTAMAYLYRIAAERTMNREVIEDEDAFSAYLDSTDITSKAIRWGIDNEADARRLYTRLTGRKVVEVGSCPHPYIPNFACSPDGFYYDEMKPVRYVIEIKCPSQAKYMEYAATIHGNDSLRAAEPDYYWQTQGEMMCLNADRCDFVTYCPWQSDPLHVVELYPDPDAQAQIAGRIARAEEIIQDIISKLKQGQGHGR